MACSSASHSSPLLSTPLPHEVEEDSPQGFRTTTKGNYKVEEGDFSTVQDGTTPIGPRGRPPKEGRDLRRLQPFPHAQSCPGSIRFLPQQYLSLC